MAKPRTFTNFPKSKIPIDEPSEPETNEKFQAWRAQYHGSYPEYLVFTELEKMGFEYGVDFQYQSSELGGRQRLGGAVVDFELPLYHIAGRVQGEYWHLRTAETREHDITQELLLMGRGWTVVDMMATEIVVRARVIVRMFLEGRETPFALAASRK